MDAGLTIAGMEPECRQCDNIMIIKMQVWRHLLKYRSLSSVMHGILCNIWNAGTSRFLADVRFGLNAFSLIPNHLTTQFLSLDRYLMGANH